MSYQREFEKKLSVGLVGVGSHCYRNLLPAMNFLPVEIRAVCDLNRQLAEKTARQYGCPAVFTDDQEMHRNVRLDAIIASAGPAAHPVITKNALRSGVNVWMEKPPALRASQVEEMIALRQDRAVMVGFKKAFMPAAGKVREILASPEYAPLYSMMALYPMEIPANGKTVLEKGEFTNWLGNGCHPLSLMISLGGPVKRVTTLRAGKPGGACVLEFEDGALGTLVLAAGAPTSQPVEEYRIFCKGGMISIEDTEKVAFQRGVPLEYGKSASFAPDGLNHGALVWQAQHMLATLENMALFTQGMYASLKSFCDAVLSGRPVTGSGSLEHALMVMKVYEAALVSDGQAVEIR